MKTSKELDGILQELDAETATIILLKIEELDKELCRNGISTHNLVLDYEEER